MCSHHNQQWHLYPHQKEYNFPNMPFQLFTSNGNFSKLEITFHGIKQ